jgi:hypothetical protein
VRPHGRSPSAQTRDCVRSDVREGASKGGGREGRKEEHAASVRTRRFIPEVTF